MYEPYFNERYAIIEICDSKQLEYALSGCADLSIGDLLEFHPDYHGGSPWAFDHPIAVDVHRYGNMIEGTEHEGEHVGRLQTLGIDLVFQYGRADRRCAYKIAIPEEASAIFEGVPLEDVFV